MPKKESIQEESDQVVTEVIFKAICSCWQAFEKQFGERKFLGKTNDKTSALKMNLEAKAHTKTRTVLNIVTKPSYKDTIIPEQNTKKE